MSNLVGFKFRVVNEYLIDSLSNSYIYFSNPEQLNDPFDCRVDVASALESAIGRSSGPIQQTLTAIAGAQPLFEQIQRDIVEFGVFSLARSLFNSVMWSQYADEHRGVCLTYSFPEEFTIGVQNKIFGRAPVDYGNEPITDWLIDNAETVDPEDPRDFAIALMKKLLTVKSEDWGYEEEYRLIRTASGPLEISGAYLTQVCFGMRMGVEDQARVEQALDDSASNALRLRMARSKSNFGLVAVEI